MKHNRSHHSSVIVNDTWVYILGGSDPAWTGTIKHKFSATESKPEKTIKISNFEVVPVKTCFRFNLLSKKWENFPDLITARHSFNAIVTKEGWIYVIGGSDSKQNVIPSCERFPTYKYKEIYSSDSSENENSKYVNKWLSFKSLNKARAGIATCYHKNFIYAFGGYCPKTGQVFDYTEYFDIKGNF